MTPIVQFGTSRFLQAHVDLFLSEALSPAAGEGPVSVVQTTGSAERAGRVAAFDAGHYPVRLLGLRDGRIIDRTIEVRSVARGLATSAHWPEIERVFVEEARTIISNTGDRGYDLDPADRPDGGVPRAFPAKLLKLLHARFRAGGEPLDLYPCELVGSNGDTLRRIVLTLAGNWSLEARFREWVGTDCRWVNSLVDRIVSAPIEPAGAIAEPYALWAIEAQPGIVPPCRHDDIVLTDRLVDYERRKLLILNLGHSYLVELWRERGSSDAMTVHQAMNDTAMAHALDDLYEHEVLPVFDALGIGDAARAYRMTTMERFSNPFLEHRLAEIAINHDVKRQRRFAALVALAEQHAPALRQPRLRASLAG